MIWIPFWAAGVINGLGHWIGYRNGQTSDNSRNIIPFGIIVGGEELHNNHHLAPAGVKLSHKWFEFDIGWMWLNILTKLKLAKIRTPVL
jgi:stearoyl-CoA desaturase (delta-9 desaturase)